MSERGAVVVFEAEVLAVFAGEADLVVQPIQALCLACWFPDVAVRGECAAACVGEPVTDAAGDVLWSQGEPVEFYVTTDPARLAQAARTAARRAGGAR